MKEQGQEGRPIPILPVNISGLGDRVAIGGSIGLQNVGKACTQNKGQGYGL